MCDDGRKEIQVESGTLPPLYTNSLDYQAGSLMEPSSMVDTALMQLPLARKLSAANNGTLQRTPPLSEEASLEIVSLV